MTVPVSGENVVLDRSGVVYVPERRTLIAAICSTVYEQRALFGEESSDPPEVEALQSAVGTFDPLAVALIVRGPLDWLPESMMKICSEVRCVSSSASSDAIGAVQKLYVGTLPIVDREDALGGVEGLCVGGFKDPETSDPLFILQNGRLSLPFVGRGNAPLAGGFVDAELLALPEL